MEVAVRSLIPLAYTAGIRGLEALFARFYKVGCFNFSKESSKLAGLLNSPHVEYKWLNDFLHEGRGEIGNKEKVEEEEKEKEKEKVKRKEVEQEELGLKGL